VTSEEYAAVTIRELAEIDETGDIYNPAGYIYDHYRYIVAIEELNHFLKLNGTFKEDLGDVFLW